MTEKQKDIAKKLEVLLDQVCAVAEKASEEGIGFAFNKEFFGHKTCYRIFLEEKTISTPDANFNSAANRIKESSSVRVDDF